MNELKQIIKTVITKEIEPDKAVFADGFVLSPAYMSPALKGNGKAEEITIGYQLDFFFKTKGETMAKAKALLLALGEYPTNDVVFSWEETVRLWRATVSIETI